MVNTKRSTILKPRWEQRENHLAPHVVPNVVSIVLDFNFFLVSRMLREGVLCVDVRLETRWFPRGWLFLPSRLVFRTFSLLECTLSPTILTFVIRYVKSSASYYIRLIMFKCSWRSVHMWVNAVSRDETYFKCVILILELSSFLDILWKMTSGPFAKLRIYGFCVFDCWLHEVANVFQIKFIAMKLI